jgi:hypothetical protein
MNERRNLTDQKKDNLEKKLSPGGRGRLVIIAVCSCVCYGYSSHKGTHPVSIIHYPLSIIRYPLSIIR